MARAPERGSGPGHPWGRQRNLIRFQVFLLALLISCWLPAQKPTTTKEELQCQARTMAGTQCRRIAPRGQRTCWQHRAERGEAVAGGP